ncbi:serine/arginine repetitive matrix protein 2 [Dioscorea cayenensis subsp. rotundata]|uniref:Serine/arginine repetitive matrix protein 2 n=1 Tax=Dioscorea cayennensis subsp. rotundata TaxID=55577 RepID=A0AB40BC19_DIOCR|nr:serine/arginine repetitive matrix protein 2 [Dioscorea cayenensis subsp. rotundata]
MPPSPALRCSPGRDVGVHNNHKRGRSLESGFPLKPKDDDLVLFNEMQNKERDNFLLHTSDDLDDSIARLRYYSDFKLGINIPARGETSDLLKTDGEKNDYDWLLTPPDTPLFPSLDDEEPQTVHLAPRGRQRSQPISIRSSMTEKTHRTSRGSPSPHRLSPSPRSTTGVNQSRGTPPSGGSYSSPTAVLRPTTPSRRSSTPTKPSSPTPRSSTPTLRRSSNDSNGQGSSSGRRGTSPVTTSRGNSASPKLRGWQTNLPGFSSDPPPNLRTSLADRPSSYVRGSSPASRNGRQSMSPTVSRNRRQSMSPTASRSASSSHSHDRDHFSSYSKGSAASSCDDDLDSLHSTGAGMSCGSIGSKNGTSANIRTMVFSKRPVRTLSSNSTPKRSFDSVLRQMDQRKTPQNMFRPLLSSVPTTTFYIGKANTMHRPMFSRNSSLTTSSNTSSEPGACVVPDVEASDHHQNDLSGKRGKPQDPELHEEIFKFDKADDIPDSGKPMGDITNRDDLVGLEKSAPNSLGAISALTASESSNTAVNPSILDRNGMMATCSKCGNSYSIRDPTTDVCQECAENDRLFTEGISPSALLVMQNEKLQSPMADGKDIGFNKAQLAMEVSELPDKSSTNILPSDAMHAGQVYKSLMNRSRFHLDNDLIQHGQSDAQENSGQEVNAIQTENIYQQSQEIAHQSTRVESPEGTGISVLLMQKSSSNKWPVVQGRPFSATNILCSEPSYVRDHASSMKRSMSRESTSASSSIDMGSWRQPEYHMQLQLNSQKGEMENVRNDCYVNTQSAESSNFEISTGILEERESFNGENGNSLKSTGSGCTRSLSITHTAIDVDGESFGCTDSCMPIDSFRSQFSHPDNNQASDTLASTPLNDGSSSCINSEGLLSVKRITRATDPELEMQGSSVFEEEEQMPAYNAFGNDISGVVTVDSSSINSERQVFESLQDRQMDSTGINLNITDEPHEHSASTSSETDLLASALESNVVNHSREKSITAAEAPGGCTPKSFTLEEAADTILFCNSIVLDIAYKAAIIAMEKEEALLLAEARRPTPTILGNPFYSRRDSWMSSNKQAPKPQRARRKRLETNTNTTAMEPGEDIKVQSAAPSHPHPQVPNKVDSAKPPKLESKCNCTIM